MNSILEWRNETGISSYPFASALSINIPNLFLDAQFVQFDNYVPKLKKITVNNTGEVTFKLLLQKGNYDLVVPIDYTIEDPLSLPYGQGRIIFGFGLTTLINKYRNKSVNFDNSFLAITVTSIPSTAGVFSFEGLTGDVDLTLNSGLFLNFLTPTLSIDAVSRPSLISGVPLKTINGQTPDNNNFNILTSPAGSPSAPSIFSMTADSTGFTLSLVGSGMKILPQLQEGTN